MKVKPQRWYEDCPFSNKRGEIREVISPKKTTTKYDFIDVLLTLSKKIEEDDDDNANDDEEITC